MPPSRSLRSLAISAFAIVAVSFATVPSTPARELADDAPTQVVVLRGGHIHSMTEQGDFVGSIVITDGKISAIGEEVEIPESAKVIDLSGYTIVPGLIDCRSTLGLTPAARREAGSRGALNILDGINPFAEDWRDVAPQGVTAVYVQPSNAGIFGGQGAVLRVAPAVSVESLVINAEAGAQVAIGLNGATSRDRYSEFQRFRNALQAVKEGRDPGSLGSSSGASPTPTPTRGGRGGPPQGGGRGRGFRGGGRTAAPTQPDRTQELLENILAGELAVRLEVHHPDTIRWALELADAFEINLVLDGLSHPQSAAAALATANTPRVVGPMVDENPPSYRADRDSDWLSQITQGSSRWALATFGETPRASRLLRVHAASAVASGLDRTAVLRAVTVDAAGILGLADQLGSLAPGKQADIAVFAGDPLDPSVAARLVMSRGEVVFESQVPARLPSPAATVSLPSPLPSSYALQSQRVWDGQTFQAASVWIHEGRVAAVGPELQLPEGTPVFDVGQAVITPGLVAAHSYLGQASNLTDDTESDASHLRATDVIDPRNDTAQTMLQGGFINVAVAPSSVNTSSGVMGQLRLGAEQPVAAEALAGKFSLANAARNENRFPASLAGQYRLLLSILSGQAPEVALYLPPSVAAQVQLERATQVKPVSLGERSAVIAAESRTEIDAALDLFAKLSLQGAILGPSELDPAAAERMANLGAGLIVRPIQDDDFDRYRRGLVTAAQRGVVLAFAGDSPHQIRQTAALLVNAGLSEEIALQGLTLAAANLVQMTDGTGSLVAEGPADLVIWTGSPLDLTAHPAGVIVAGELVNSQ